MRISVAYLLAYARIQHRGHRRSRALWLVGASGDRVRAGSAGHRPRLPGVPPRDAQTVLHRVRRGAVLTATATLVAGLAVGTLLGWGLVELFPDTLAHGERLPYAANQVVAFAAVDQRSFDGHHTIGPVNGLLGLFGALSRCWRRLWCCSGRSGSPA